MINTQAILSLAHEALVDSDPEMAMRIRGMMGAPSPLTRKEFAGQVYDSPSGLSLRDAPAPQPETTPEVGDVNSALELTEMIINGIGYADDDGLKRWALDLRRVLRSASLPAPKDGEQKGQDNAQK